MIVHQLYQHGQDVPQVSVLVHSGQIVKDGLELILLHASTDHHKLLDKSKDVGPGISPYIKV